MSHFNTFFILYFDNWKMIQLNLSWILMYSFIYYHILDKIVLLYFNEHLQTMTCYYHSIFTYPSPPVGLLRSMWVIPKYIKFRYFSDGFSQELNVLMLFHAAKSSFINLNIQVIQNQSNFSFSIFLDILNWKNLLIDEHIKAIGVNCTRVIY